MIGAYCTRCAIRSRKLPKSVYQKATLAAGIKAASDPAKFPAIFFQSSAQAQIAYRLLVDVTPEERMEFFNKKT
jgi:hypothetical protein